MLQKILATAAVLALPLILTACGESQAGADEDNGNPTVVCTTTMIADLTRNIAGEHVNVVSIMRTGEDPHIYDVKPNDAKAIKTADLVLYNGHHLESTLLYIIETRSGESVALAESPKIEVHSDGVGAAVDPHCWMNAQYFKVYAEQARDALVKLDPDHADDYIANAANYIKQLDELHEWVLGEVSKVERQQRVMITSHDAFRYLGEAYGIDVYAVIGLSTEEAPKPQDVNNLIAKVKNNNVKALFIETSTSNTLNDMVRKVARETDTTIGGALYSDSLGEPGTEAGTYVGMMRHNITTLVEALK